MSEYVTLMDYVKLLLLLAAFVLAPVVVGAIVGVVLGWVYGSMLWFITIGAICGAVLSVIIWVAYIKIRKTITVS